MAREHKIIGAITGVGGMVVVGSPPLLFCFIIPVFQQFVIFFKDLFLPESNTDAILGKNHQPKAIHWSWTFDLLLKKGSLV